ncbi:MAG: sugar phosphate isomerase/epimerase [Verrucomicrobia bacterium]|nr:sugar phosphate isomerase/epimerase [Verrucomicrobiota bacterium]
MSSPSSPSTRRQFLGGILATSALTAIGRAATPGYVIGCYTRPWAEFEPLVALDEIAAAGYKHAGLMTAKGGTIVTATAPAEKVAGLAAEAKARGLAIASIWGGDFLVPKSPGESVARLKTLVDHCVLCGCPSLLLGGTGKPELVGPYYDTVKACCDYAAGKRVGFVVKPHGGTNSTGPECRKLIESVGHRNFGLWYDPGNIFYYSDGKRDPVDDAATVDGLVAGMSIKDFRAPKEVMVTPGTGLVNFPKVLSRLRQGGFRNGPLIVECTARGDRATVTAEARRAREYLESIVR